MRIVEKYYSYQELAWTYSVPESTIREAARRGEFGPRDRWLLIGKHVRIPATGALFFQENHLNHYTAERAAADLVKGRTLGEARRAAMVAGVAEEREP